VVGALAVAVALSDLGGSWASLVGGCAQAGLAVAGAVGTQRAAAERGGYRGGYGYRRTARVTSGSPAPSRPG